MQSATQKIAEEYVGVNEPLNLYTLVHDRLIKFGMSKSKAKSYAIFCQLIYKEVKDRHDVIDGMKKIVVANKLLPKQVAASFGEGAAMTRNFRLSAGMSVAAPIVDRLASLARLAGIELNECALSVTKVALDVGGAGTGAVSLISGIGIPLLALSILSTFNDSASLAKACFL